MLYSYMNDTGSFLLGFTLGVLKSKHFQMADAANYVVSLKLISNLRSDGHQIVTAKWRT